MDKTNFVSVDTIFSKLGRDLRGTPIEEADVIEWIGEALSFMKVSGINEEAVAFMEVKDNRAPLPEGFKCIIQVARNLNWIPSLSTSLTPQSLITQLVTESVGDEPNDGVLLNELDLPLEDHVAYYRPYFDLKYEYNGWVNNSYYRSNYSPVRLSNNTFFKSLVAQEKGLELNALYNSAVDEYTLIGNFPNMELLLSFSQGYIAVSYVRARLDEVTGYPLIPDNISVISAIVYYVKWKMSERLRWAGVEGFKFEAQDAETKWLKYVRQAINSIKIPSTIDEYQNEMEQSLYLIPRTRLYQGFFGKLGREEDRRFSNPDGRKRFTYNRYNYGYH